MPDFVWTEDRVAQATKLWIEGRTALQIAAAMGGGVTRSAILGLLRRRDVRRETSPPSSLPAPAVKASGRRGGKRLFAGPKKTNATELPQASVVPSADGVAESAPRSERFACLGDALLALHDGCRWPLEDGTGHFFCGARQTSRKIGGDMRLSPYCGAHHARSIGLRPSPGAPQPSTAAA